MQAQGAALDRWIERQYRLAAAGMRHSGRPLGELLISRGLISEEQLQAALTQQKAL